MLRHVQIKQLLSAVTVFGWFEQLHRIKLIRCFVQSATKAGWFMLPYGEALCTGLVQQSGRVLLLMLVHGKTYLRHASLIFTANWHKELSYMVECKRFAASTGLCMVPRFLVHMQQQPAAHDEQLMTEGKC